MKFDTLKIIEVDFRAVLEPGVTCSLEHIASSLSLIHAKCWKSMVIYAPQMFVMYCLKTSKVRALNHACASS